MTTVTLDHQEASETCQHGGSRYAVSRGSFYRNGERFGLYLAGGAPVAVHLQVRPVPAELQMTFIDPARSPWREHHYLGRMLTAAEARADPRRQEFLELAEQVWRENAVVRRYLEDSDGDA